MDLTELSPREIFENVLPDLAKQHSNTSRAINAVLAIELTGNNGGAWSLDLTGPPETTRGRCEGAQCVVRMEADRFSNLLKTRKVSPWLIAYTKRKIKVEGDMPTVLKVGQLLTSAVREEND